MTLLATRLASRFPKLSECSASLVIAAPRFRKRSREFGGAAEFLLVQKFWSLSRIPRIIYQVLWRFSYEKNDCFVRTARAQRAGHSRGCAAGRRRSASASCRGRETQGQFVGAQRRRWQHGGLRDRERSGCCRREESRLG